MGAYLSEPITKKETETGENEFMRVASASMQGWRMTQEDAHNTILNFDTNSSLFAVYDGHGGHEVAVYTAQKLPPFIKANPKYRSGEVKEALIDSFVEFDRSIINRDVVAELKKIAMPDGHEDEEQDAKEVDNLYEEATMPLEDVLTKYVSSEKNTDEEPPKPKNPGVLALKAGSSKSAKIISPFLKAKTTSASKEGNDAKTLKFDNDVEANGDAKVSPVEKEEKTEEIKEEKEDEKEKEKEKEKEDKDDKEVVVKEEKEVLTNGVTTNGHHDEAEEVVNGGKSKGKGKGKGKSSMKKDTKESLDEEDEVQIGDVQVPERKRKSAEELYKSILNDDDEDLEDSDDEEDEMFGDKKDSDTDEEEEEEEDEDESEEDDEMEDDTEDEDEEDMSGEYIGGDYNEEPGNDSGCTAVVALLRGHELYVANAGDSRCIVCRDGKAIEMSFDHKPEDEPELKRIEKAGGRVTPDGRVNGGLNLSRAIGDHAYKTRKFLPLQDQMISPVPDVHTLSLDCKKDSFILLACDGIWNSLSSQEVADFVQERLAKFESKDPSASQLKGICEELFDHCLAPDTVGDGTGCDNMTAVLVKLRPAFADKPKEEVMAEEGVRKTEAAQGITITEASCSSQSKVEEVTAGKRPAEEIKSSDDQTSSKKLKLEEGQGDPSPSLAKDQSASSAPSS